MSRTCSLTSVQSKPHRQRRTYRSSETSDRRRRFEEKEMHKKLLSALCGLAAAFATAALAQDSYPNRAVRMLVPNAPGSSIDTMSRIVAAKLGDALGQSVFVENRDGAGGLIGVEAGKNAKPDGYTLICASNGSMIIAPLLKKPVPYDAVADFPQVGSFAVTPNVLIVNPDLPVKSVKELIDYAKANAAQVNMATAGVGSQSHLSGVLFMAMAGFDSLAGSHKGGGTPGKPGDSGQRHCAFTAAPRVRFLVMNVK